LLMRRSFWFWLQGTGPARFEAALPP
jgi:hypothetical protein